MKKGMQINNIQTLVVALICAWGKHRSRHLATEIDAWLKRAFPRLANICSLHHLSETRRRHEIAHVNRLVNNQGWGFWHAMQDAKRHLYRRKPSQFKNFKDELWQKMKNNGIERRYVDIAWYPANDKLLQYCKELLPFRAQPEASGAEDVSARGRPRVASPTSSVDHAACMCGNTQQGADVIHTLGWCGRSPSAPSGSAEVNDFGFPAAVEEEADEEEYPDFPNEDEGDIRPDPDAENYRRQAYLPHEYKRSVICASDVWSAYSVGTEQLPTRYAGDGAHVNFGIVDTAEDGTNVTRPDYYFTIVTDHGVADVVAQRRRPLQQSNNRLRQVAYTAVQKAAQTVLELPRADE